MDFIPSSRRLTHDAALAPLRAAIKIILVIVNSVAIFAFFYRGFASTGAQYAVSIHSYPFQSRKPAVLSANPRKVVTALDAFLKLNCLIASRAIRVIPRCFPHPFPSYLPLHIYSLTYFFFFFMKTVVL